MCRMLQPLFVSCFLTATAPLCLWQKQQMRCLFKVWLHLPHVCIHTRVCIHVCAVTNICSCLWRPEDDLRDHASGSVYHFDFETRPLTHWPDWRASTIVSLVSASTVLRWKHATMLGIPSGGWTQVLMLVEQALSHFHSPKTNSDSQVTSSFIVT